jgi:hypothetical protein
MNLVNERFELDNWALDAQTLMVHIGLGAML